MRLIPATRATTTPRSTTSAPNSTRVTSRGTRASARPVAASASATRARKLLMGASLPRPPLELEELGDGAVDGLELHRQSSKLAGEAEGDPEESTKQLPLRNSGPLWESSSMADAA